MKNNLTTQQHQVFNKYFETHGDQHIAKQDANLHIGFFDFEVYRDNDVVLEIKVGHTCICMFKQINHLIITIL